MESALMNVLTSPAVFAAVFLGASVLILFYILKLFKTERDVLQKPKKEQTQAQVEKKKEVAATGKSKKKVAETRWSNRSEKQSYSHAWLLVNLKGHTGQILDLNFSSNGKYLASCGDEDPDPGGDVNREGSISSDCSKESSRPPSVEPSPRAKRLSRRQRKNRRREDPSSPLHSKKDHKPKKTVHPVAKKQETMNSNFDDLNIDETKYSLLLYRYLLTADQLINHGYPVVTDMGGMVIFYRYSRSIYQNSKQRYGTTKFDVNAREFVPRNRSPRWPNLDYANSSDGQLTGTSSDSSENLEDSEENSSSSSSSETYPPIRKFKRTDPAEHNCVRCGSIFLTTNKVYVTQDSCSYHWGRLQIVYDTEDERRHGQQEYVCCRGKSTSRGCTISKYHVWNGIVSGMNGPYRDYVFTKPPDPTSDTKYCLVLALDCEMCYTVKGLELTKVTLVNMNGDRVYHSFVRPKNEILDYNTRYSGITWKDLNRRGTKSLKDVQKDLMQYISSNTILIGHGLENDLRALKIVHYRVVDTAQVFPHYNGFPYKRSLKSLASAILGRTIQCSTNGHDSYEDARACMDIMKFKIGKDLKNNKSYV